jgi:Subtilase family
MEASEDKARPLLRHGEKLAHKPKKVRGGDEKFHPRTFEQAQKLLAPMTKSLRSKAEQMPAALRGERIVFEAELLPNYLAGSYSPSDLRAATDLVPVGSKAARGVRRTRKGEKPDEPTKSLLLAGTVESVQRLDELLGKSPGELGEDVRLDIAKFERIELATPKKIIRRPAKEGEQATEDQPGWEAVLHPPVDVDGEVTLAARDLVLGRWRELLGKLGGSLHEGFVRSVGNLLFMPVSIDAERLEEAAAFNPLRVLRPMPRMRNIGGELRRVDPGKAEPSAPAASPSPLPNIAIFDGGVDANHPLLAPFVRQVDLTTSAPNEGDEAHGTLVTSAALYGHIELGQALSEPPSSVDHFRVLPRPANVSAIDEVYWVTDQVEAILRGSPHKLAVLSYGPDEALDEDSEPHRFTSALDRIAYLEGITIAVAVGNNGHLGPSPLGLDRVQPPSDGANVLGVGACQEPTPADPVRASYSAVGPGRAGMRIQPIGVSFGGVHGQREFVGAAPGGGLQFDAGTSFSAPAAARGIATLIEPLGQASFDAAAARAFAAHFAQGCDLPGHDFDELGHGRLADDYVPHLDCGPSEMTILVEDTIKRSQTKGYPFPVPAGEIAGKVSLRWTVSFLAPTDEEEAVEYSLAGLEVDMRPNKARRFLRPPKGQGLRAIPVDTRTDGPLIAEREAEEWKLAKNARTRSGGAYRSEQTLAEEGKWETVVRHSERMLGKSLHLPEVWVTYYERGQGELIDPADSADLDFAMLMTISAPKVIDLYETIAARPRYASLVPVTTPIQVEVAGS